MTQSPPQAPPPFDKVSAEELEARRLKLQQVKDAALDEMHLIVAEQQRRVRQIAVAAMLDKLPPAERNALLEEMKAK